MIDLSYLTEEEQEKILAVLQRDAQLKRAEEQRVQNLQRRVSDRGQLKYMTGEWFYETKQLRHQDRIHGSDIIRASMKHTHKPLTILELSQILPEKPSFVSSENKEVFVPPVLCGILQEPHMQLSNDRSQNLNPYETPQDPPKLVLQSPTKQRKNPFNSEVIASPTYEEQDSQVLDGAAYQTQTLNEKPLPSSDCCISLASDSKQDSSESPVPENASDLMPKPENRTSISSQDCFDELDDPGGRQTNSAAPRGILKHLPTSSSTGSLFSLQELQSPVSLESASETWIDRKQVRFSSMVGRSRVEWQDGKELGEHSLLDNDSVAPSEAEHNSDFENTVSTTTGTCIPLLSQSPEDSQDAELGCKNEACLPEQEAGQHHVLGDVSVGRREKDKPADEKSTHKENVKLLKQKETSKTQNSSHSAADSAMDKPVKREAEASERVEVRTLQLTALQNTPFQETVTSVASDVQQEATNSSVAQLPERLSSLKAFWEQENSGPKILFTREEARHKDIIKTGIEALHGPQMNLDVESLNNNVSPQKEMIVEDIDESQEKSFQSPPDRRLVALFKEDGTYRANPVLIYEETDDSLTESQISGPLVNVTTPVPSSEALDAQKQEGGIPVPLLRQSSSSPQEDKPAKISELKNFWEKEYSGPRVITARNKEPSSCSLATTKVVSPQSDLRASLGSREKSEEEAQTSPHKTTSNVVKSLIVTDKGFVSQSPDSSQPSSFGNSGDVPSTCHQYQVKTDVEAQQRPLSPTKRSKDQDDEVRRSPSKTCHPRVLPREPSSPQKSRLEGSPLKAFPINIDPQTKVTEEHQVKPIPMPRQRKSPSHEAKQTDIKPNPNTTSAPLPLHPEDKGVVHSSSSTSPQSKKATEKMLGTFTRLARSFIPQDYQHYLGPQDKAHVPSFHQEKVAATGSDEMHRPQIVLRDTVGNQSDSPNEGNPPSITSWNVQNQDGNSSHDTKTRAWSLPRASAGSYDDTCSPVMSALKRLSSRTTSSSKSLENLNSQLREEKTQCDSKEEINQSVDDVSSVLLLSNSKQMKSSVSVPVLQQDESDSDSTFETNLGWRRNTGSSMSNISLSSGMASMSSVSGSISSIYHADLGDIEVQGSIQFAVNYIQKLGEFHIFVVHCRDLAVADTKKSRSDPYVKCYLVPDKTKLGKRKTTVKKKILNPTYNEILRFKIGMDVLKTQNLNLSVWHNDTFGRNTFLGEVDLDFSEWDFNNTQINEYALKSRVSAQTSASSPSCLMDSRGQMRVALRFLPQTSHSKRTSRVESGEVQIWVKDCKNLPPVRGVIIDPFVKCAVLPDTSRKSRQKTRVVKRTANPMFNHTMVYDGFRPEDLREACVEITVWDHDRLNNHYIGGLRLGLGTGKSYGVDVVWMDSTTDEADLWQRMLLSNGEWVEDVLPLRLLVMAKSISK